MHQQLGLPTGSTGQMPDTVPDQQGLQAQQQGTGEPTE